MPARPLPAGLAPKDLTARQWSTYLSQSGIQASASANSFTPVWGNDFSADPSGDISYHDFGSIVVLWVDASLTGTSDTLTMSLSGLPAAITPSGTRVVPCFVGDDSTTKYGGAIVGSDGTITFSLAQQHGGGVFVFPATGIFTASGSKGLVAGWMIQFSK